jgi:hypothetical protein
MSRVSKTAVEQAVEHQTAIVEPVAAHSADAQRIALSVQGRRPVPETETMAAERCRPRRDGARSPRRPRGRVRSMTNDRDRLIAAHIAEAEKFGITPSRDVYEDDQRLVLAAIQGENILITTLDRNTGVIESSWSEPEPPEIPWQVDFLADPD